MGLLGSFTLRTRNWRFRGGMIRAAPAVALELVSMAAPAETGLIRAEFAAQKTIEESSNPIGQRVCCCTHSRKP